MIIVTPRPRQLDHCDNFACITVKCYTKFTICKKIQDLLTLTFIKINQAGSFSKAKNLLGLKHKANNIYFAFMLHII